jgi:sialic acid synthase SpsE
MREHFGCSVGLSDHSLGIGASICAAALGASVIEKHFTLSRKIETPDSFFSIEPQELKELVENVRIAEKALGEINYGVGEGERNNRVFRRSLFVVKDIKAGEAFTETNLRSIRPGNGLPPKFARNVFGKKAKQNIKKGTPLKWSLVDVKDKC